MNLKFAPRSIEQTISINFLTANVFRVCYVTDICENMLQLVRAPRKYLEVLQRFSSFEN